MALTDQILAVVLVLGLMAGVLWLVRRRGGLPLLFRQDDVRGNSALEVLQRLALTPQHSLHLVRAGGRVILVGTHPAGVVFGPQETFQDVLAEAAHRSEAQR